MSRRRRRPTFVFGFRFVIINHTRGARTAVLYNTLDNIIRRVIIIIKKKKHFKTVRMCGARTIRKRYAARRTRYLLSPCLGLNEKTTPAAVTTATAAAWRHRTIFYKPGGGAIYIYISTAVVHAQRFFKLRGPYWKRDGSFFISKIYMRSPDARK